MQQFTAIDSTALSPYGSLIVTATTANGAYPVPDAQVTVTKIFADGTKNLQRVATTDHTGNTQPIPLSTPPQALSLHPTDTPPYARYTVRVDHPSYQSYLANGVDIFPNTTATLTANLQPQTAPPQVLDFPEETLTE